MALFYGWVGVSGVGWRYCWVDIFYGGIGLGVVGGGIFWVARSVLTFFMYE